MEWWVVDTYWTNLFARVTENKPPWWKSFKRAHGALIGNTHDPRLIFQVTSKLLLVAIGPLTHHMKIKLFKDIVVDHIRGFHNILKLLIMLRWSLNMWKVESLIQHKMKLHILVHWRYHCNNVPLEWITVIKIDNFSHLVFEILFVLTN